MNRLEQRLLAARLEIAEAELKRLAAPKKNDTIWSNPLLLAIAGATVTAIVSLLTNKTQLDANRQLERDKLESSLIIKAIDKPDPAERLTALQFLVKAGLISDANGKIGSLKAAEIPRIQEYSAERPRFRHLPIFYSQAIVDRILKDPAVPYPPDFRPVQPTSEKIKAIILHYTYGPDAIGLLRSGRPDLKGPLAHWVVQSDGSIGFVATEGELAFHAGILDGILKNSNTIGIETSGEEAFGDEQQVENLVRLVLDVADRWSIPTDMIVSHAEKAQPPGRKADMLQQAPEIRKMIHAIRSSRTVVRR